MPSRRDNNPCRGVAYIRQKGPHDAKRPAPGVRASNVGWSEVGEEAQFSSSPGSKLWICSALATGVGAERVEGTFTPSRL